MAKYSEELQQRIERYVEYYNNERIKQKLADTSPVQYRIHASQSVAYCEPSGFQ